MQQLPEIHDRFFLFLPEKKYNSKSRYEVLIDFRSLLMKWEIV